MPRERQLLTIGHSYVVAGNRLLAHELAACGAGRWRVTAIAPSEFRGDLRRMRLEPIPGERCEVRTVRACFDRSAHFMWYAGLRRALAGSWDIVHCWEEPYVHVAAQIAGAIGPHPRLVFSTFQNISKRFPWPVSRFERESMRRADGWIAFGEAVRTALGSRAGYAKPVRTIPPGVDVDRFAPSLADRHDVRGVLGWSDDAFVVGYLGRFVEQKGIRVLMQALERLELPWRALFVGGGPLQREIQSFGERHPGSVHVQTGVTHADVPRWINAMSVLCAPSLSTPAWREQFGRMLIEAMACGVPVIASDSGEMPTVVGDAGWVVPEGDAAALASKLAVLREDDDARRALALAGRARAVARHAWPAVAQAHLAFFESLL